MLKLNVQSFGDIITNSSSEIYTIYDLNGINQIESALSNICKVLNPNIDWRDHLTIELEISDMYDSPEYDDDGNRLSMQELYNKKFNEFCDNKSNEEIMKGFSKFYEDFCSDYCTDDDGRPCFDLLISPKTKIGKQLEESIYAILFAFEHVEIYT